MKSVNSVNSDCIDKSLLQKCKQAIRSVVPKADIILYGSRARGNAQQYSDYDLLALIDSTVSMDLKEKLLSKIYPIQLETGEMISLITYSKNQWNSPLYKAMPLHKNIDKEGVTV